VLGDSVRRRNRSPRPRAADSRPEGRRFRWKFWAPLLLAAATLPFLIGYLLAVAVIFPPTEVAGDGIAVPALRGSTEAEARQSLAAAGLGGIEVTRLPHPQLSEGEVIAQSPLPGQQLRAGSTVRIAVSSGVARVLVPDVVGFNVERARGLLERLGFTVAQTDMESIDPPGRVLAVEPGPGSRLPLPAEVSLTVSTGPALPPDTVVTDVDTSAVRIDTLRHPSGTPPRDTR
jgi:eukaryotic-like serine/threonine-protein kinase